MTQSYLPGTYCEWNGDGWRAWFDADGRIHIVELPQTEQQ